ncbi:MAG: FAD-binding protein, partial [Desulfobacterales bacterium]|nr:FAD-binding protein [Desulfobacterales bacterium]
VEMLRDNWPGLQAARIAFPAVGPSVELYPEKMARALELRSHREELARELRPHLNGAEVVGMPAIFGIQQSREVMADLASLIGAKIFEIPTIPPSVPGLRIKETMEGQMQSRGLARFTQKRVLEASREKNGEFVLDIGEPATNRIEHRLYARGVIFAGGRFLGKGLYAGRKKIVEPLFGLPVFQPSERTKWHRLQVFDPRGHAVNMAGIEIDDAFRPIGDSGQAAWENLYAAGAILAHQDWMRMKCGAGLSIATAYGAVKAFAKDL